MWRYLSQNYLEILALAVQHVGMTLISLSLAGCIALPLGTLLVRLPALRTPVLSALGIIYTIPSLALLVLLIPFTRLGPQTAIIALVGYAQIILVRNVVAGFDAINPAIIEAARGMGMSAWQRYWRVELPLALPVILAGVRVATLAVVAIGAVAALIDGGGLGQLLFRGVGQGNRPMIITGAVALAALAFAAGALITAVERRVRRTIE